MSANAAPPNRPSATPIRQSAMRRFWLRMAAIYGHKWASAYGDAAEDDKGVLTVSADTWQRGLLGITEPQIAIGLQACIVCADPWPPTLPQFRAMCFEIPPIATVRAEFAARHTQRSPFANLVWTHIDGHRYRSADAERGDRMLREAYELAREHVIRGGALPEPRVEIAAPEPETRAPASESTAADSMETLCRKLFGVEEAT